MVDFNALIFNKGILVVGPTNPGRHHDYALFKKEIDPEQSGLSSVDISVDLGFQGIRSEYPKFYYINILHKKPRLIMRFEEVPHEQTFFPRGYPQNSP